MNGLIIVQYRIHGLGSDDDLSRRNRVEESLDEAVRAAKLGAGGGNAIGNGTVDIFVLVSDLEQAKEIVLRTLRGRGELHDAVVAACPETADSHSAPVVFWPEGYTGHFSYPFPAAPQWAEGRPNGKTMSAHEMREAWLKLYQQLEAAGEAWHDSQSVPMGLMHAYDELSAEGKACIHPILEQWFVSENNNRRYDAKFLTGERRIRELAPAVEAAINRLKDVPGPEARDEVKMLRSLQKELAQ